MNTAEIEHILMQEPAFAALPQDYRNAILAAGRVRNYPIDDTIFRQDDKADGIFYILKGQTSASKLLKDGRELLMSSSIRSGWFGEVSALDLQPRSFTFRALMDTQCFHIDQSRFDALIGNDFCRARFFINVLCDRVRTTYEYGSDALSLDGPQRLAKTLLNQYQHIKNSPRNLRDQHDDHSLPISQEDLSSTVGISRQRTNRILKDWQNKGIIQTSRKRVEILDFEALEALIQISKE